MELAMILKIAIIPSVFSLIMIVCGILAWKMPLGWSNREKGTYPHYSGKLALISEKNWNDAQVIFGKTQSAMGIFHVLLEVPEVLLFVELCKIWSGDDVTIPAAILLCAPGILMICLGNLITSRKLQSISSID